MSLEPSSSGGMPTRLRKWDRGWIWIRKEQWSRCWNRFWIADGMLRFEMLSGNSDKTERLLTSKETFLRDCWCRKLEWSFWLSEESRLYLKRRTWRPTVKPASSREDWVPLLRESPREPLTASKTPTTMVRRWRRGRSCSSSTLLTVAKRNSTIDGSQSLRGPNSWTNARKCQACLPVSTMLSNLCLIMPSSGVTKIC